MRSALSPLRQRGILLVDYLDDILILGTSKAQCLAATRETVNHLLAWNFAICPKKSQVVPSQTIQFLGWDIDLRKREMAVPPAKLTAVCAVARKLATRKQASPRDLARLLGTIQSMNLAQGPNPHWEIQHALKLALREVGWDTPIVMTVKTRDNIKSWIKHCHSYRSFPLSPPSCPVLSICTDASNTGWGGWWVWEEPALPNPRPPRLQQPHSAQEVARCLCPHGKHPRAPLQQAPNALQALKPDGVRHGHWKRGARQWRIEKKELWACLHMLQLLIHLYPDRLYNKLTRLVSDNTTVVWYVQGWRGGTPSLKLGSSPP